ncbi:MAG: M28 family peptidase [Clostridiales bacterium]|nr:M28 family peptidase [Clostridiales bacterium]
MKKRFSVLSIILCIVVAALCLVGCSDHGAPTHAIDTPNYIITPEQAEAEYAKFMTEKHIDRTTFTAGEKAAAADLVDRLKEMGYTDATTQSFTASENDMSNLQSQNVVAHIGSKSANAKNVIIGAYYDNRYKAAYNGAEPDGGEGAVSATAVAAVLTVADYVASHQAALGSQLRVTIAFFGASYLSVDGAKAFLNDMSAADYDNTVLMVEMQRLCGDHIYAFSDARPTKREALFDKVAADNGLNIYKPTSKSPLITGLSALNGVPYYQWAHNGVFTEFFNTGIPTLNLVGANWESAVLSDIESTNHANLLHSENDTLRNVKKYNPDYAQKIATAASLVVQALYDDEFVSVMTYDRKNFPNTDVVSTSWIWYLVVLGAIMICVGIAAGIGAYLKKKYPIVVMAPPQMKMAVFGMDYEDKSSADIFIDVQSGGSDNIFEGIENNAPKTNNPFADIFPPAAPTDGGKDKKDNGNDGADEQGDDPFDQPPTDNK